MDELQVTFAMHDVSMVCVRTGQGSWRDCGVVCYIRNVVLYKCLNVTEVDELEVMWIKIMSKNDWLLYVFIY